MQIEYGEQFLKDLKKLKHTSVYDSLKTYCFEELPAQPSLSVVRDLKKMQGFRQYYRIRVGDYRIGLKDEGDKIVLMRVLHRKDIYRFFP